MAVDDADREAMPQARPGLPWIAPVAAVAVVLAATAPLLWRYRLFHRERFAILPVLGAVVLLCTIPRSRLRAVAIGALLALGILLNATVVAYAVAATLALALDRS